MINNLINVRDHNRIPHFNQVDIYAGSVFLYEAVGWNIYISAAVILAITAVYTVLG